jgi:hypothetical protein
MAELKWTAALLAAAVFLAGCAKPAPEPVPVAPPPITKPGTTFTATPNPILTDETSNVMTLKWSTTAQRIEVHLNGPDGKLFGGGGSTGTMTTGPWVVNGMTFYLQDMGNPHPDSEDATLGKITAVVQ